MADNRPRALAITGAKFEPYALAIGQMALAWNELHEALGILFGQALEIDRDHGLQCAAVWGAISSDRQKRLVLAAAMDWIGQENHQKFPQAAADILWLIDRANSLEDKRNNVVHAPLSEVTSALVAVFAGLKIGDVYPGGVLNERALKLTNSTARVGKDLLKEIVLYRDYVETLAAFSDAILKAWRSPTEPWPERPALPPLKDKA